MEIKIIFGNKNFGEKNFGQIDQIWQHLALGKILEEKKNWEKKFVGQIVRIGRPLCPHWPNGPNLAPKSNFLRQNDYPIL